MKSFVDEYIDHQGIKLLQFPEVVSGSFRNDLTALTKNQKVRGPLIRQDYEALKIRTRSYDRELQRQRCKNLQRHG
jgi:hypothetical protein